jgi:DNA-binding PadR family transcriptional regulator
MFKLHHNRGWRYARAAGWSDGAFGHRRRGRHGGGGRGRVFDQGDLRIVILRLLAEMPRHGYEIIKLIEDKLGGAYSPSPGVIYPNLTMLEELGYATVRTNDGAKKLYAITPAGAEFLDQNRAAADAIFERMARIGETQSEPAPQILRAMDNLRTALRLRVGGGNLGEAETAKIADVLDAAAKSIEQI